MSKIVRTSLICLLLFTSKLVLAGACDNALMQIINNSSTPLYFVKYEHYGHSTYRGIHRGAKIDAQHLTELHLKAGAGTKGDIGITIHLSSTPEGPSEVALNVFLERHIGFDDMLGIPLIPSSYCAIKESSAITNNNYHVTTEPLSPKAKGIKFIIFNNK